MDGMWGNRCHRQWNHQYDHASQLNPSKSWAPYAYVAPWCQTGISRSTHIIIWHMMLGHNSRLAWIPKSQSCNTTQCLRAIYMACKACSANPQFAISWTTSISQHGCRFWMRRTWGATFCQQVNIADQLWSGSIYSSLWTTWEHWLRLQDHPCTWRIYC